jgi:hypothetical protein
VLWFHFNGSEMFVHNFPGSQINISIDMSVIVTDHITMVIPLSSIYSTST